MKKKFSVYFTLLTLVGAFFVTPISVLGETRNTNSNTVDQKIIEDTSKNIETNTEEILQSDASIDTTDSTMEKTPQYTTELEKSDSISEESQPRGPTIESSSANDTSKKRLKRAAVRKEIGDIITKATITDGLGNPLTEANQWTDIQMNFEFSLPNNTVEEDDITVLTLPKELKFLKNQEFDVKNSNGDLIAVAQIDATTKTVTLTYKKFVESHSDITGSMFFTVRIDTKNVTENKKIPITIDINGEPRIIGDIDYEKAGDDPTEKFAKYNWFLNNEGTEIRYVLRINASGKSYNNTIVEDMLSSDGVSYDKSSFKISKGNWVINNDGIFELKNEENVTGKFVINFKNNDKGFTIDFGDIKGEGYQVVYTVKVGHKPINGEMFKNKAQMRANDTIIKNRDVNIIYQTAGGNADGYNYTVHIHKRNEQGENLAGAEFEVIRDSVGVSVGNIVTDGAGNGSISGLLKDNYTIKEVKAPEGYQLSTEVIKISPNEFDSNKEVFKEFINKKIELVNLHGQKTWNDKENQDGKRPEKINVNLLANGKVVATKEVSEAEGWQYAFENLPKYENGQEIVYTVTEDQVPEYNTEIKGYDITNSYTPGKTSVSVTKAWNDNNNQDGLRPNSIQAQLYANGKAEGAPVELNEGNQWSHTWNDLPEKAKGQAIVYTVKEVTQVPGYTGEVDDSNLGNVKITNTHTPEVTKIAGQKTWNDNDNQDGKRPEKINVNLLANGKVVATKEVSEAEGWQYTFENLPKYENGQEIVYTVTEDQVPEYNTEINGYDITNSYTPGKTSVSVTKAWNDNNNQDGLRPNSIQAQLYANGKAEGAPVELNEGNQWSHTWNDLPEKAKGQAIVYTVKEVTQVPGYTGEVDDSNLGNVKITNTHTPEVTKIAGQKTWNDKENQDGKRPEKINVNLLANGKVVATKEVSEAEGWQYAFENLPKYENGQAIVYTVTEDQVPEYNTEIKGYDITNSYTPGKTSVSVTKAWNDNNNQDGLRPNSIQAQLYANGKAEGSPVELNEGNQWSHTWNDLPEKAKGQAIVYTVKEVTQVPGYTGEVDDSNLGNVKITNTHTPEVTKIAGQKTWNDKENQDGKRPEKINVNLLANGKVVATKEVSEAEGWQYAFENLPKYENGQAIVYTVTEDQVPEYNTEIKGYDITNSYTPGKTSVSVTKAWNDNNNQDGLRPNSIQAQLYANGKAEGAPVELNEGNQWSHTWNDLPEKAKGQAIVYTVKEVTQVPGYTGEVDDSNLGNVKITNTHTPEVTKIAGQKTWNDKENQDGKRPEKINVNLLANGKVVATKEVSEAEGWQYAFENLPKYENGQAIVYTVTEDQVPEYNTEINGYDITNSYTPGKTSVSVTKAWNDNNNQDGLRPNSIQAQLYANGKAEGAPVELNEGNQWSHTWNDLPEKAKSQAIVYTVKEVTQVPGYTGEVDDSNLGNVKITNTHTPETKSNGNNSHKNMLRKHFPQTGEQRNQFFVILGVVVFVGTVIFLFSIKKKNC
ncbi:Cna B-type domain-containing protein (plasmid) [Enterococcus faecalis]